MGVAMKHGRTEAQVLIKLEYLYNARGLRPGTAHGPRSYPWFPSVLDDEFTKEDERQERANPCGFDDWELRNAAKKLRMDPGEEPF